MERVAVLRGDVSEASVAGYGSGYGYGSGSGSGYGSGYGYGYGDGSGCGDGYGSGSGYGDGYGYGDGSGCGDGSGSGSGSGYWKQAIDAFASGWPPGQRERLEAARTEGGLIAFWRSDSDARPANGGSGTKARIGLLEELPGPLPAQCGRGALHATLEPGKWKGERLWIVALFGPIEAGDDKFWALKREILGECLLGERL